MKVLVVDDTKLMREMVGALIKSWGHIVYVASGAKEAYEVLDYKEIDLILMDVEMPKINGYELTRGIREKISTWIPIIFLTANTEDKKIEEGINAGGDDYVLKPVNQIILGSKIRAMGRIVQMKSELDEANRKLIKMSSVDALTDVVNRRGFNDALNRGWRDYVRVRKELSLIFLDIDFFKPYNDNYGHQQGDECLQQFASVLKKQVCRPNDILARYGGEEFVILLPHTDINGAIKLCLRIIDGLKDAKIPHEHSKIAQYVTASLGVSSTTFGANSAKELVEQADSAVYSAKELGRNRYMVFSD